MKNKYRLWYCFGGIALFIMSAAFGLTKMIEDRYYRQPITISVEIQNEVESTPRRLEVKYNDSIKSEQKLEIQYYKSPIQLNEDERWFVECLVAGEAGWEPYNGKKAVAQCIFDAMLKDGISAREVRERYQYAGWNDMLEYQSREMYIEVMDAVRDIFDLGQFMTEKPILFFYAPALCDSPWHESQNYVMTIGGHKFFYADEDENAEWTNILLTKVNEYGIIEP